MDQNAGGGKVKECEFGIGYEKTFAMFQCVAAP